MRAYCNGLVIPRFFSDEKTAVARLGAACRNARAPRTARATCKRVVSRAASAVGCM